MKTFRLMLALSTAFALSSCLNDDNSGTNMFYGLDTNSGSYIYANTATSYVAFGSTGNWTLNQSSGADWCTPGATSGHAAYYWIRMNFDLNTTGKIRTAVFTANNTSSSDTYVTFSLLQYAHRGDGSLGSSPMATAITGDDGSAIAIQYDTLCRPVSFLMTKDNETLHRMTIAYSPADSTVSVNNGQSILTGKYDSGYQPDMLLSERDTIGYFDQTILGNASAFNVEWRRHTGERMVQALLFEGQAPRNGSPSEGFSADSIRHYHVHSNGEITREYMSMEYSETSNRNQTVDVNQLLLGVEECNPLQLMALFSDARCQYVVSKATTDTGSYSVSTTTNADGSINTMTVTDKQGQTRTYTFSYQ